MFQYLTSYLTGKAAAGIEGLSINERNYEIALKTPIERFGKEDVITEEHMSRLLGVRPVHTLRDIERLRTLYDDICSEVRSLEALGASSSTYCALLLTVLRKSIPSELCLAYFQMKAASPKTPEDELLGHRYQTEITDRRERSSSKPIGVCSHRNRQREGHQPANCVTPVPIDKNKEVMSRERRCYKCAKKKLRAAECRTARWLKCAKCSGLHATGDCELNQRLTRPPSFEDAAPLETTVQSWLQVGHTRGATRVLLQRARAYA
ncbi:hypothetical protein HPB49_010780 [Dermacentor silvarum]|uniref:Uncharacterized protein n=1 Tax=Dermacentor silvarum TaxID=543639 RepID=A0ACB8CWX6_DERSI|nr:hypothetical protein HPB49_010780 [Dermacentor silvarum]